MYASDIALDDRSVVSNGDDANMQELCRNALSTLLDNSALPPGSVVAILDLVPQAHAATLAELWARGLVPAILDPHLPEMLQPVLLSELFPAAVLTWTISQSEQGESFQPCPTLDLASPDSQPRRFGPTSQFASASNNDIPAYIAYTSGSTGTPKGVVIGRRAFKSFVQSTCDLYELTSEDRRLLLSNPAFDLAMEQVGTSLHAGCPVIPASPGLIATDPFALAAEVCARGITVLSLPTGVFNAVGTAMDADTSAASAFHQSSVRLVMAGGEAPDPVAIRGWAAALPEARLLNGYGPTECTVVTSYGNLAPDEPITVGTPLPGVTYSLRDGELIIGGVQVGLGYLEKRVGGFESHNGDTYATGDAAQVLADGRWVIEGRRDRMLKVSGYRVDPVTVEGIVTSVDGVSAAHVVSVDGALGCLIVPDTVRSSESWNSQDSAVEEVSSGEDMIKRAVSRRCKTELPWYAVPRLLGMASEIPLTARGKRNPEATASLLRCLARSADRDSAGAGLDLDFAISEIWRRYVGDPEDLRSFAETGADSLTAVSVRGALLGELDVDVPLPVIVGGNVRDLIDASHRARAGVHAGHLSSGQGLVRLRGTAQSDSTDDHSVKEVHWVFLPPMSGAVTRYLRLSRLLPDSHQVSACENAREDLEGGFATAVSAMSDVIAAEIPIDADLRLSGFSLGGVYARAVAVELASRGFTCCSAHLIDPPDPSGHATPERTAFLVFAQVGLAIPGDGARFLRGPVATGEVAEVREDDIAWDELLNAAVATGMATMNEGTQALRNAWEIYRLNASILRSCDVDEIAGQLPKTRILIGATGEDIAYDGAVADRGETAHAQVERVAPSGAWSKICPSATFDRLGIDHFALLDPPHDIAVAQWLTTSEAVSNAG